MLREFISTILFESIKSDLIFRYPDVKEFINELSLNDPSGRNKYLQWNVKHLLNASDKRNEFERLIQITTIFDRNKQLFSNKDINFYTPDTLETEIEQLKSKNGELKSRRKERLDHKIAGGETIYEDDVLAIKNITTYQACKIYGAGTRWCITRKNDWIRYEREGSQFFFIFDKINDRKYVIEKEFGRISIVNELDVEIGPQDLPDYLNYDTKILPVINRY